MSGAPAHARQGERSAHSDERQTAPCRQQWAPPTAGPHDEVSGQVDRMRGKRSQLLTLSRERNRVLRSHFGNESRNEANSHLR